MEDDVVAERDHQLRLPCLWLDGHCVTDEATYLWNITEPYCCHLAVVKDFTGTELVADTSGNYGHRRASRVIVSTGADEKIRIRHEGHESQCG